MRDLQATRLHWLSHSDDGAISMEKVLSHGLCFPAPSSYSDIYIELRLYRCFLRASRRQSPCLSGLLFSSQPIVISKASVPSSTEISTREDIAAH